MTVTIIRLVDPKQKDDSLVHLLETATSVASRKRGADVTRELQVVLETKPDLEKGLGPACKALEAAQGLSISEELLASAGEFRLILVAALASFVGKATGSSCSASMAKVDEAGQLLTLVGSLEGMAAFDQKQGHPPDWQKRSLAAATSVLELKASYQSLSDFFATDDDDCVQGSVDLLVGLLGKETALQKAQTGIPDGPKFAGVRAMTTEASDFLTKNKAQMEAWSEKVLKALKQNVVKAKAKLQKVAGGAATGHHGRRGWTQACPWTRSPTPSRTSPKRPTWTRSGSAR